MANPSVEETLDFIKQAHAGQLDKGGEEYWLHPFGVMNGLGEGATDEERLIALLHDVIEDTDVTADDLRQRGYSEDVVRSVERLSRPDGIAYMDWIRSIAASGDRAAIRVKIADNEHNSSHERNAKLPEGERGIIHRYQRSLKILRAAI